ncbi:MAG: hypothetical protein OEZ32_11995 [Nitrospinota bacterium]|nr:hypothetical protein [Nitrospinota bacterium]
MAGFFSSSSIKRLPVAIQGLPENERMTFVMLRMRRDKAFIARELGLGLDEAGMIIKTVQEALIKSGAIDMIQNPVFFQVDHAPENDDGPGKPFELSRDEMDMVDQLELDNFFRILRGSLEMMDKPGRRLLSLWFNKEMKAKDIVNFYKRLGIDITDSKPIEQSTEQDVFYALEKNIKKLLKIVRSNLGHKEMELTPSSLKAILTETGV